ncbi:acyltransferase family protein [Saccharothrix algeriensis]|uniref:Peptidoglycan/LPS O-acetylase OafA/YrhL n=1 Tax=Saccharothrix algeriensis TaxID=173560 RepID=A0ABS2SEU1_9PSEU|nr:acyltransferase family protein [Saccharothrix algeriensis]MBM7814790.1 peptidoglycan/LPS O-acetylase OafA/YrhL [Saccharothrix algeriensis]
MPTTTAASAPPRSSTRRFRPELQGLRGVAAALVVVYHVWLGRVSGGVDVFFLISGFLVTGQLLRAAAGGGIEFRPLWGRMITRLFPAALTVLAAVLVAGVVLLPENQWFQTIREVVAAALYLENWQLVADAADYFGRHNEASAVQHFWSLSIQGQFYLLWPLLVALVVAVARRAGHAPRRAVGALLLVVFAASLACSVALTAVDQPLAYFHSLTRAWEFALGGLLALATAAFAPSAPVRLVLGWLGLLGLVACGLVLRVGSAFPGYAALWPTLCAAAVIATGSSGSRFGADRLLSTRPLRYLGDLSYALYLWHWPVLVFYLVVHDRTGAGLRGGLGIVGLSLALAVLTHHLVEQPVRRSSPGSATRWGAYRFAGLAMAPVLVAAGCWQVVAERQASSHAAAVDDPDHPGAAALEPGFRYWGSDDASVVPPLVALPKDFAGLEGSTCTTAPYNKELTYCHSPVTGTPDKRIVVVGDSHMQQYLAALGQVARQRNWEVVAMNKGACPFSAESNAMPGDAKCLRWNADAFDKILSLRPDLVLTNGTRDVRAGLTEETPPGFVAQWRKLEEAGIAVAAVRDNPRHPFKPSECASTHGAAAPRCGAPRATLLSPEPPYASIPDLPSNVEFLDFSDYFCPGDHCPPVIGNVHVYLDDSHISATYMKTMASAVERAIDSLSPVGGQSQ